MFPVCGVLLGCAWLCALFSDRAVLLPGCVLCFLSLKIALLEFCFRDKVCNFFSNVYSFMVGDFLAGLWCIAVFAGAIPLGRMMFPAWNMLFSYWIRLFLFSLLVFAA